MCPKNSSIYGQFGITNIHYRIDFYKDVLIVTNSLDIFNIDFCVLHISDNFCWHPASSEILEFSWGFLAQR